MTDNFDSIKALIESQLPEFVRVDNETFVAFLEAYYEWLEQPDNPNYTILNHKNTIDIDKTLDEFIEHFKYKFLNQIPSNVLVDQRLLLKYITQFYTARGTEKSYRLLFRILFDKDIDFLFPKDYILKVSDGKWVKEIFLFTKKIVDNDPFLFSENILVGLESGSTALIDGVQLVNEGGLTIYKMIVNEFDGEFNIGETAQTTLENGDVVQAEICGFVSSIDVIDAGLDYQVGDFVSISDGPNDGINALGKITKTFNPGVITSVNVLDGGTGYRVGDPVIFDETGTLGFGAIAKVGSVSPDLIVSVDTTIIGDHQNRVLNSFYTPLSQNINDIVIEDFLNFVNIELGEILTIDVIDGGKGYDPLPLASVGQQEPTFGLGAGVSAVLQPVSENAGAIAEIKVVNNGVGYTENPIYPVAELELLGNGLATADVKVSGGPLVTDGRWINYDGRLDSIMVLQDGDYYQLYSYVIRVDESLNNYKKAVKEILHPAGMKLFGQVDININLDTSTTLAGVELPENRVNYVIDTNVLLNVGSSLMSNNRQMLVKPEKHVLLQEPVFILNYENEIIDGYDEIVLQDFVGFTQAKSNYNREAIIDILVV